MSMDATLDGRLAELIQASIDKMPRGRAPEGKPEEINSAFWSGYIEALEVVLDEFVRPYNGAKPLVRP